MAKWKVRKGYVFQKGGDVLPEGTILELTDAEYKANEFKLEYPEIPKSKAIDEAVVTNRAMKGK